jgi:hypothetical protein
MAALIVGKVYHLPQAFHIPRTSIARSQKRQNGFFNHPVLVVSSDTERTYFYALTRTPPAPILDLRMCLHLGPHHVEDSGPDVLELAPESSPMCYPSWVNLEQKFTIETVILHHWVAHVRVEPGELVKLHNRIEELEALQNRFIYKPLVRDLRGIPVGTVLMVNNDRTNSGTFGAPILVVENIYPRLRFFRVKIVSQNPALEQPLDESTTWVHRRWLCLLIGKDGDMGHDGSPVLLVRDGCQNMREKSYVELAGGPKTVSSDQVSTWCWPPIILREESMQALYAWCAGLEALSPWWRSAQAWEDLNSIRRRWRDTGRREARQTNSQQAEVQYRSITGFAHYSHGQQQPRQLPYGGPMCGTQYSRGYSHNGQAH